MELEIRNLEKYDFANAKKGDEVIVASSHIHSKTWYFRSKKVKSVSDKRRDVTFDDGSRYDKTGRKLGEYRRYDTSVTIVLASTKENITQINSYMEFANLASNVMIQLEEVDKGELFKLTEDKLKKLNEVLAEVFDDSVKEE
jgi:hypothetical protein